MRVGFSPDKQSPRPNLFDQILDRSSLRMGCHCEKGWMIGCVRWCVVGCVTACISG